MKREGVRDIFRGMDRYEMGMTILRMLAVLVGIGLVLSLSLSTAQAWKMLGAVVVYWFVVHYKTNREYGR